MTKYYIVRGLNDEYEVLIFYSNNICQNSTVRKRMFDIWKKDKLEIDINGNIKESELNAKL